MTKLKELDNLNRSQWFGTLKSICKARADLNLFIEVLLLVLILVAILVNLNSIELNGSDAISLLLFIAMSCMLLWGVFSNYRFRKKSDSLNTPGQLLNLYEKTVQDNAKCWFGIIVLLISKAVIDTNFNGLSFWLWSALFIIVLVVYIVSFFKDALLRERDKEIIMALRELAEEKRE